MHMKMHKKNIKNGVEKKYYVIVKNGGRNHDGLTPQSAKKCKLIWLGLAQLDELKNLNKSIAKIIERAEGTDISVFNPEPSHKERLKEEIKKLWEKHGKLSDMMVRSYIGPKNYFYHFGGMIPIYMELGLPLPKVRGKDGSFSDVALLNSLRESLKRHGKLTKHIILNECVAVPSTYIYRFGSLPEAYKRVGHERKKANG